MWALILVLASGAHLTIGIPAVTVEATEGRSCMGQEAAKLINDSDVEDKVVTYSCVRQV